jgi:2-haloacid dehalogenase
MSFEETNTVKILAFDTFGTVVDWHGSIASEVDRIDLGISGNDFALAWRSGYKPAMQKVMSGKLGWTVLDDLHRLILDEILQEFSVTSLSEQQKRDLNMVWHRLKPWPDAVEGLSRLKRRYMICTLSNGNIGLLADMAKNAGLPWDCILSAEVFGKYKPHPEVYLGTARVFDVASEEVMLVAAHHTDLAAARACGLKTAYVERPTEYGDSVIKDVSPSPENTLHARDFVHLADLLGC